MAKRIPGPRKLRTQDRDIRLGQEIRRRRAEKNLTGAALAKPIGMSHQAIQRIENGESRIYAVDLARLAQHLRIPIGDFFPDDDKNRSAPTLRDLRLFAKLKQPWQIELAKALIEAVAKIEAEPAKTEARKLEIVS